eukprot:scaffold14410_cov60-Phaeocystis_antarctica.AAC.8
MQTRATRTVNRTALSYISKTHAPTPGHSSTFSVCLLPWCRAPDSPTCSRSCSASSWCPPERAAMMALASMWLVMRGSAP